LDGFRCGDGTHSGKKLGNEMCFETARERLAIDLSYLLMRFGVVASFGGYETTFKQKYGDRKFPFWRLTICEVDNFDVLSWDGGVHQTLNAQRDGDLVWSLVREKKACLLTPSTYDFSVPGAENFVAGNGVCCHNTYGPRMRADDGRVVSNFIVQALRGEPMTVYGDGSQMRSFCYVDDMVAGLVRLMEHEGEGAHLPVNLGNPRETTMLELAGTVAAAAGCEPQVAHMPLPPDDPSRRRPDISRARSLLGWEPAVPLEEGVEHTVAWFRFGGGDAA
jgi:UDP-glucuronate decarboxylase